MLPRPETEAARRWVAPAAAVIAAITALRIAVLAASPADLFVDEAQYWLWGQDFAFGYYSKPPMVAWAIGLSTWASGSDAAFWIRLPAPLFHAGAAFALAALAAELWGRGAAVWTAAAYLTLPMVAAGSLLIGADAMMAPFYAAALYAHAVAARSGRIAPAIAAGALVGLAALGKYAALYFIPGVLLAALSPALRISPRQGLAMALAGAAVLAPNLIWNAANGFATLEHTADNTGWWRGGLRLNFAAAAEFLAGQILMAGPLVLAVLVWLTARAGTPGRVLLPFVLPPLVIVTAQALISHAYPNWAATAYLAGAAAVVAALLARRRWLVAAVAVNAALGVALAVVAVWPAAIRLGGDAPVAARYLGRAAMSRAIITTAELAGGVPVLADRRDILADLFHEGRGSGLAFYAPRPAGRPMNHYQATYPLPRTLGGQILFVTGTAPVCDGAAQIPVAVPEAAGGAYRRANLALYLIPAGCADALF